MHVEAPNGIGVVLYKSQTEAVILSGFLEADMHNEVISHASCLSADEFSKCTYEYLRFEQQSPQVPILSKRSVSDFRQAATIQSYLIWPLKPMLAISVIPRIIQRCSHISAESSVYLVINLFVLFVMKLNM